MRRKSRGPSPRSRVGRLGAEQTRSRPRRTVPPAPLGMVAGTVTRHGPLVACLQEPGRWFPDPRPCGAWSWGTRFPGTRPHATVRVVGPLGLRAWAGVCPSPGVWREEPRCPDDGLSRSPAPGRGQSSLLAAGRHHHEGKRPHGRSLRGSPKAASGFVSCPAQRTPGSGGTRSLH